MSGFTVDFDGVRGNLVDEFAELVETLNDSIRENGTDMRLCVGDVEEILSDLRASVGIIALTSHEGAFGAINIDGRLPFFNPPRDTEI